VIQKRTLEASGNDTSPISVIRRLYDAFFSHDFEAAMLLLDENVEIVYPDSVPMKGHHFGHSGLAALSEKIKTVWKDHTARVMEYVVDGDRVVAIVESSGRVGNDPNVVMPVCEIWRVKNGRAAEVRVFFWDTHFLVERLEQGIR